MKNIFISVLCLFFNYFLVAQVGIGTTTLDGSAQLDITATDRGLLIPRVALTDVTNTSSPVNSPVESLMVYNTNAAVSGGDGTGFYFFNGTRWEKLIANTKNISTIPLWNDTVTINSTSGADITGYDSALEPSIYNSSGNIEVKLVIRYSSISGIVNFQLRAHDGTTESWPIVWTDSWITASTQNGGVITSEWKSWNAGINAHEIHLFGWVNLGASITIESAYVLVRSQ